MLSTAAAVSYSVVNGWEWISSLALLFLRVEQQFEDRGEVEQQADDDVAHQVEDGAVGAEQPHQHSDAQQGPGHPEEEHLAVLTAAEEVHQPDAHPLHQEENHAALGPAHDVAGGVLPLGRVVELALRHVLQLDEEPGVGDQGQQEAKGGEDGSGVGVAAGEEADQRVEHQHGGEEDPLLGGPGVLNEGVGADHGRAHPGHHPHHQQPLLGGVGLGEVVVNDPAHLPQQRQHQDQAEQQGHHQQHDPHPQRGVGRLLLGGEPGQVAQLVADCSQVHVPVHFS